MFKKPWNQWSDIELVEFVSLRLQKQGGACLSPNGGCVYANSEGKNCAAGLFLTHLSKERLDQLSEVGGIVLADHIDCPIRIELVNVGFTLKQVGLIKQMQSIHDNIRELHSPSEEEQLEFYKSEFNRLKKNLWTKRKVNNLPYSQWSNKEIIDYARDFLLVQYTRAISPAGDCLYLTEDNNRCAVGAFFTKQDEHALKTCRNGIRPFSEYMGNANGLALDAGFHVSQFRLLRAMQSVHDCNSPEDWLGAFWYFEEWLVNNNPLSFSENQLSSFDQDMRDFSRNNTFKYANNITKPWAAYSELELVEFVEAQLRIQGKKADKPVQISCADPEKVCVYLNDDGACCAVGQLLKSEPDKDFLKQLIGSASSEHVMEYMFEKHGITIHQIPILMRLQAIHDRNPPAIWSKLFENLRVELTEFGTVMKGSTWHITYKGEHYYSNGATGKMEKRF